LVDVGVVNCGGKGVGVEIGVVGVGARFVGDWVGCEGRWSMEYGLVGVEGKVVGGERYSGSRRIKREGSIFRFTYFSMQMTLHC
jgi:hypothetical protein